MVCLECQGYPVMGVELSEQAVEAFFSEQGLVPHVSQQGAFKVYQAGQIELWCGDFFSLNAQALVGCRGVYDRAALIALPPLMRAQYAEHLNALLPSGCQGLLITLDYDQGQKAGPPFAVTDEEVQVLFALHWALERLEERDILRESGKFLQDGVTRLEAVSYTHLRAHETDS